ncbi:methyltransferase [Candidatus Woesearchaeota archaeon]|nr:methyltransferase [Candidatus Woesearchaeota archaeon]
MKGAIITQPGLEAVPGKELQELVGLKCSISKSVVLFETEKFEDFCTLCYKSQSAIKILYMFFSGKLKSVEDVIPSLKGTDLAEWVDGTTFAVRSKIVDNPDVSTLESERVLGEVIHEKYNAKVNLEDPDVTFFLYVIGDTFYFGVDFAGFDLSKRNYKVFALADSIKATVAYSLVRLAGYKKDMSCIDPFAHSGAVAIEAAFYATGKPINYYNKDRFAFLRFPQLKDFDFDNFFKRNDNFEHSLKGLTASDSQQRHVRCAEKNAKIAGLNKQINFTRMDVEWLDTKFEKGSVDVLISNPPKVSRLLTEKGIEKVFQELFYISDFILKQEGRVVLLVKNYSQILKHAQRHNFVLKLSFKIMQGKEEFTILVLEKGSK